MALVERRIDVTIELGTGAFGETGAPIRVSIDQATFRGHRIQAHIVKAGGDSMGEAHVRIFGLTRALMNQLSALNQYSMVLRDNRIIISAGDDVNGMHVVFKGNIAQGWVDLNQSPSPALQMVCYAGLFGKMKPVAALSYPASASVVEIMGTLASRMGLEFENNGVSVILSTPYFPGTAWEQARQCAEAANINWWIDEDVLSIWPKGGHRFGSKELVSVGTGMVGYPTYNSVGISLSTLFNPKIRFGAPLTVKSIIKQATGDWVVTGLYHEITSMVPGGEWFTRLEARPMDYTQLLN